MSLRLPRNLSPGALFDAPLDTLEAELLAEKAASLGRAGRKVEQTLADLRAHVDDAERQRRTAVAADAVHALLIQRELLGLHRQADVVDLYAIPRDVLAKVGVR